MGSDAVVHHSLRALGFEPVLHMYYDEDFYHESPRGVIVDVVVCFEQRFEQYRTGEIARAEGGIPVRQYDERSHRFRSDSCPDPEPMVWVTPMMTYCISNRKVFSCLLKTRQGWTREPETHA